MVHIEEQIILVYIMRRLTIVKERKINIPFKWHNKALITKVPKPDMHNKCCMYCVFSRYCISNLYKNKWYTHSCTSTVRKDNLNVYYEEITTNLKDKE